MEKYFHLHLISDSTGETINAVAKAVCTQFETAHPIEHNYGLVRSAKQLERAIENIEKNPGPVLFSIVNQELRYRLEQICAKLAVPSMSVLDPFITAMAAYLNVPVSGKVGGQHEMNKDYFRRIAALNYTMMHDDGQSQNDLQEADIILTGVSRTSKTPTCMYLANRGFKAANVPLIRGIEIPAELLRVKGPLIVGLTTSVERLLHIRKNRLLLLNEATETNYIDPDNIKQEITEARRLMARQNWPIIDVSRRSIEEVATAILNLHQNFQA